VNIDGAIEWRSLAAAGMFQQKVPRQHAPGMPGEGAEQLELSVRERHIGALRAMQTARLVAWGRMGRVGQQASQPAL
jgi:hypothetical protein